MRKRGAAAWDMQGYMGHRLPSQTEIYAEGDFVSVQNALQSVIDEIEVLVPGTLHRKHTGDAQPLRITTEAKMS